MTERDHTVDPGELAVEARAWVSRIVSGEATSDDTAEMMRWRARSDEHARALIEAVRLRRRIGAAGAALREDPAARWLVSRPEPRSAPMLSRRALLAAGAAASAASVAGLMAVQPPLDLWPSFAELRADYRTGTGEQRTVALGQGVQLNTRTSLARCPSCARSAGRRACRSRPSRMR